MIGTWGTLELLERIGAGSYGEVYRAWDPLLEREIALKLVGPGGAEDGSWKTSILKEGRLLARIQHENVATVHGVEAHGGKVGLAIELIRGQTLRQIISNGGPLSADEATHLAIKLCHAISAVHRAGLLHRDIKAENVMREDGGRIVLVDFGLGEQTTAGYGLQQSQLAGTPFYLAPELFEGKPASRQSDIYALGVLLFHLTSGSYPIESSSFNELVELHRNGQARLLRDTRPDLPRAFVEVVERALATNPARRFSSAGHMEAALAQFHRSGTFEDPFALTIGANSTATTRKPDGRGTLQRRYRMAPAATISALVLLLSGVIYSSSALFPTSHSDRSIAVLPFDNLSSDGMSDYLSDGITEDIITSLANIADIRVISRASAMLFKSGKKDVHEIARNLGVRYILQGSVRRIDKRLRVSAKPMMLTKTAIFGPKRTTGPLGQSELRVM